MNTIGESLERLNLKQKAFVEILDVPYIDAPLLSKMMHGIVNPIPEDARKIAEALHKPLERVWHPSDLDYGMTRKSATIAAESHASLKKDIRSKVTVRKCYRESKSTAEWFTLDKLQMCGYTSGQSWFDACVRRFKGEYAAVCKAKASEAGRTATKAKENIT